MAHREVITCEVTLAYDGKVEKPFTMQGFSIENVIENLGKAPKETIVNIEEI